MSRVERLFAMRQKLPDTLVPAVRFDGEMVVISAIAAQPTRREATESERYVSIRLESAKLVDQLTKRDLAGGLNLGAHSAVDCITNVVQRSHLPSTTSPPTGRA